MPQTIKGEYFQWFKVDLDMWGTLAPPERTRFAPGIQDDVYLDIGAPGRCVRNFYVENVFDCEGNVWQPWASGVTDHALISSAHTDISGVAVSGRFLGYDGTNWVPSDIPDVGEGARYMQVVNTAVQNGVSADDRVLFDNLLTQSGITHSSGIFTLASGIFSLNTQVVVDYLPTPGMIQFQWYDRAASGYIGAPAGAQLSGRYDGSSIATTVYVSAGEREVEVRVLSVSGTVDIAPSGTAWIYSIGGSGPAGPTGATGPEGPEGPAGTGGSGSTSFSGLLDVQTVQWQSGEGSIHNGTQFIPINLYQAFALSGDYAPAGNYGDVSSTRTLTAGAGLTGGGDLSADRTFNVGAGWGITVNADTIQVNTTDLDVRYALSGELPESTPGELHTKYLGSGQSLIVGSGQQILVAFDYSVHEDASLFLEEDGETVVINDAGTTVDVSGIPPFKSATLEFPTSGTNSTLFKAPKNITIQDVSWTLVGDNSSIGISGAIRHHSDRMDYGAANELFTGGFIAMPVNGSTATFSDATIPSGSWIWFNVNWNDPVGDVDEIALHIDYMETF